MIGGIEPVDAGEILVDSLNITKTKNLKRYFRQYVGFLFQNFALVENKTVADNLNMVRSQARSEISVQDALARVGMAGTEDQKVFSLSGGEQQRIALARLMVKKCSLILADKPTGSLDASNAEKVMGILSELNKMGKRSSWSRMIPNIMISETDRFRLKQSDRITTDRAESPV